MHINFDSIALCGADTLKNSLEFNLPPMEMIYWMPYFPFLGGNRSFSVLYPA